MGKVLYIDAFSGISGDMFLGALIALGFDISVLEGEVGRLGIGARIAAEKIKRNGIEAVNVSVLDDEKAAHERDYGAIRELLESKMSPGPARDTAIRIFSLLAEAEGKVHGQSPDHVHFHEVGAVDSIIDIVGVSLGMAAMGPVRVVSSPLPVGRGFVKSRHGVLPLPAPATAVLLAGLPVVDAGIDGELVTPTGAAIVKALASGFGGVPPMVIEGSGFGAGDRELVDRPNLLRLIRGQETDWSAQDEVDVITTHIDDMNPQFYDYVMGRLFELGALDVTLTATIMKKERPGTALTVLAEPAVSPRLIDCILSETTSIGVRIGRERRVKARRRIETIPTQLGDIRVKVTFDETGMISGAYPEYEDVRAAAQRHHLPIDRVYRLVIGAVNGVLEKRERSQA